MSDRDIQEAIDGLMADEKIKQCPACLKYVIADKYEGHLAVCPKQPGPSEVTT